MWRDVPGYEGLYRVSDRGSVRCSRRAGMWESMSIHVNKKDGRTTVCLYRGGRRKTFRVASLVLLAFVGPRPRGLDACHNDGNNQHNWLSNLRYDTRLANLLDKNLHGTAPLGSKSNLATLDEAQVAELKRAKGSETQRALAKRFNVSEATVSMIFNGKTWKHVEV